jgi:hypothetical protein
LAEVLANAALVTLMSKGMPPGAPRKASKAHRMARNLSTAEAFRLRAEFLPDDEAPAAFRG